MPASLKKNQLNIISILVILTLLLSVLLRVFELGNIPGINADEAWYGLVALKLINGEAIGFYTPSGNLLNPFYLLPAILLHLFFEPSFVLLRMPALLSGFLLVTCSYYLTKKIFNQKVALIVMVLVTALPINIAYSRFGWDTSQTVLVSCIVIYALLTNKYLQLGIALAAAILVHPTNIGLLVISIFYIAINKIFISDYSNTKKTASICAMLIFFLGIYLIFIYSGWNVWMPTVPALLSAATDITDAGEFSLNLARLFSGATVYQYISGADYMFSGYMIDVLLVISYIALLAYLLNYAYRLKDIKAFSFVLSVVLIICAWYLLFSSFPLLPGQERFSLFLIMPVVMCVGFLCFKLLEHLKYEKIMLVTLLVSNLLMVGFIKNYFIHIHKTGGQADQAFMTNNVEPKKLVIDILKESFSNEKIYLLTSSWWNTQPMMYLAYKDKNLEVIDFLSPEGFSISEHQTLFITTFVGDKLDNIMQEGLANKIELAWSFQSYSGEPILMLYRMMPVGLSANFK